MQSLAGNLTLKGSTVQMKMVIDTRFIAPSRCTTGELWLSSPLKYDVVTFDFAIRK